MLKVGKSRGIKSNSPTITESITLGMNSKYILDFLNFVSGDEFEIFINESNMPFMVRDNQYFLQSLCLFCVSTAQNLKEHYARKILHRAEY